MELNSGLLNEGLLNEVSGPSAPPAVPPVAQWHESLFSGISLVEQWHESPYSRVAPLAAWHEGWYSVAMPTASWHEGQYGVRILAYHEAVFGQRMGAVWHEGQFGLNPAVGAWHEGSLAMLARQPVSQWHEARYAQPLQQWHAAPFTLKTRIEQWHAADFTGSSPVSDWHEAPLALRTTNPAIAWHPSFYDLRTAQVFNITGEPYILKAGIRIPILGADLSCDEGGYAWICNVSLARVSDYQAFGKDDPFTVVLFGDSYEFMRDSKSLTRNGPAQVDMTISGISPVAVLDTPRADDVTKTWTDPIMASAVAVEMSAGIPVDWQILDWLIPAYRLGVSNASPLAVIQQVAAAAGGVVEAKQDGTLLVRPKFPVTLPAWETTAPDQTFTDDQDNLSIREGVVNIRVYDKFYLSDTAVSSGSDRFEFQQTEGDAYSGTLFAYPAVWRTNLVVSSTRDGVFLAPLGVASREEEEVIEFVQGVGQTAFPIDAILSAEWLDRDLGGLSFAPYTSQLTATGTVFADKYSLLRLRYRTKAITYRAEYAGNGEAQFLLEEV